MDYQFLFPALAKKQQNNKKLTTSVIYTTVSLYQTEVYNK